MSCSLSLPRRKNSKSRRLRTSSTRSLHLFHHHNRVRPLGPLPPQSTVWSQGFRTLLVYRRSGCRLRDALQARSSSSVHPYFSNGRNTGRSHQLLPSQTLSRSCKAPDPKQSDSLRMHSLRARAKRHPSYSHQLCDVGSKTAGGDVVDLGKGGFFRTPSPYILSSRPQSRVPIKQHRCPLFPDSSSALLSSLCYGPVADTHRRNVVHQWSSGDQVQSGRDTAPHCRCWAGRRLSSLLPLPSPIFHDWNPHLRGAVNFTNTQGPHHQSRSV